RLAISGFACIEVFKTLSNGQLKSVVVGKIALNHDFSGLVTTPRPAGDLCEQLKGPLGCAKVGQREGRVGADHADQSHARKIMSFGNHLCANKNVNLAIPESAEHAFEVTHMAHRVTIHSADARVRINLLQLSFKPFRSFPHIVDVLAVALGAPRLRASREAAVVAQEFVDAAVIGQGNTARTALESEPAAAA